MVEDAPQSGISIISARSAAPSRSSAERTAPSPTPGRGTTPSLASSTTRAGSFQLASPAAMSAPSRKYSSLSGSSLRQQLERPVAVGDLVPPDLEVRGLHPLLALGRQPRHLEPDLRARVVLDLLVRRPARDHQQHPVQLELPARLLGEEQMTDVGRVEGPAQDPDPSDVPTP